MSAVNTQLPLWEFSEKDKENEENLKLFCQAWKNFAILNFNKETSEGNKIAWLESALAQNKKAIIFYNALVFSEEEKKTADSRVKVIEDKIKVKKDARYSRIFFKTIKQEESETVEDFAQKLKEAVKDCEFGESEKLNLQDQFIFGLKDAKLQKDLLRKKDFEIETVVTEWKVEELLSKRLEEMRMKAEPEEVINKVEKPVQIDCKFCGFRHEKKKEKCPAWGKKCNSCGKENHFRKMCKMKNATGPRRKFGKRRNVRYLEDEESGEDDEEEIGGLEEVRMVKNSKMLRTMVKVIKKFGKPANLKIIVDTGASCCVIGQEELKNIIKNPRLNRSNVKLKCFSGKIIKSVGSVMLRLQSIKCERKILFQVIQGSHEPILSCEASQEMGFITVHNINNLKQNDSEGEKELKEILKKYKAIFAGDGRMKSEATLDVDPTKSPGQERPRRIPVGIRQRLREEIADLQSRKLIEKVDHPVKWTSNIVIVKKKNKDQIRICLDPKYVNEAIVRKRYQIPTIEEVLPELAHGKVFTLLDCKNGFLQVPLQESSRDLTAFWTPMGIYRWKVLPFGIASAPEIFQQKQCEIVQGLSGVEVIADDILVYGVGGDYNSALLDHNKKLEKLLERLTQNGVKLNRDKAQLAQTSLKFYGHLLTDKGVKPDESKTEAITQTKQPENLKDLEGFLGMIAYHHKFIPNLSSWTEPLRAVLKSKVFFWNAEMQKAFEKLKWLVTNAPVLRYFDVNKDVVIQTDASKKGLGGVLLQENQPVIYVSKALTETEKRYAIVELELLAILFTCRRLDQYLNGKSKILVESDHQPLKGIMAKPIHQCSSRIQRMRLELLKYDIKIQYRPGREMVIPDYLSRNPIGSPKPDIVEEESVLKILSAVEKAKVKKIDIIEDENLKEIRKETENDGESKKLMELIISGEWSTSTDKELTIFKAHQDELSIQEGLIFKGNRVFIPKALRKKYLSLIHIGHPGTESASLKARKSIFWPGIFNDIKMKTESCSTCAALRPDQQKQPMLSHETPSFPFEVVSMDFCECEYEGRKRNILVVVDHFSDFIEFAMMKGTASKDVILALKIIFARQGIPKKLVSDGAHNLTSMEMKEFAKNWKVELVNSSPYYPKGNGKAEAAVKIIKNLIKKSQKAGECLYEAILEHRNTENKIGYSPAQRLLGRNTRGKLPIIKQDLQTQAREDVSQRIEKKKAITKENYDKNAKPLDKLKIGDPVMVKLNPGQKEWTPGTITNTLTHQKYEIEANGKRYVRNRQVIVVNKAHSRGTGSLQDLDINHSPPQGSTGGSDMGNLQPRRRSIDSQDPFQGFPAPTANRRSLDEEPQFVGYPAQNLSHQNQATTRTGRVVRRPAYLNDYSL